MYFTHINYSYIRRIIFTLYTEMFEILVISTAYSVWKRVEISDKSSIILYLTKTEVLNFLLKLPLPRPKSLWGVGFNDLNFGNECLSYSWSITNARTPNIKIVRLVFLAYDVVRQDKYFFRPALARLDAWSEKDEPSGGLGLIKLNFTIWF